jgi:TetR/AcrR family transcriptional regulator, transcriptional repressor for nem operon
MTSVPSDSPNDTAARILDSAERLVQVRGFNGFSYADVAAELDMTTAALHYHFPGKGELGRALIERYTERFIAALADIDERITEAPAKLDAYAGLYADVLRGQRMCLCGMLAAEYQTLPDPMRAAVITFIDANEAWVEKVLADGRRAGTIALAGGPADAARLIVSGLEGAMLVARPYGDIARFDTAAAGLLASVGAPSPARP